MKLYFHPVSSYSQKTVMAFYEKGASFDPVVVTLTDPVSKAQYLKVHPLGKLPLLVVEGGEWKIPESSIIIEYIDRHCTGGTRLIPEDLDLARQTRFRDRFFDLYITEPLTKIFFDGRRPEHERDPYGVMRARETLTTALGMLDERMAKNTWALGDDFSMADCAAAPALAYCRMLHSFDAHKNVAAYANRLLERPSFKRVQKEAEPYLSTFSS